VKRFAVYLAVLALLPLAVACGGCSHPSLIVNSVPLLKFQDREIQTFTLSATGKPSGVIALKSVQSGRIETLLSFRFNDMEGAGSAAVEVTGRTIDACWSLPVVAVHDFWLPNGPVAFPAGSTLEATGCRPDYTIGPTDRTGEQILWIQIRYVGEQPFGVRPNEMAGDFTAVVDASKQRPAETAYCLTLEVDGE
jgi:hypothetical protein